MARYRRGPLTDGDRLAASAVSVLVGAGAALATWYLTRIILSREELPGRRDDGGVEPSLEEPSRRRLKPGQPG